MTNTIGVATLAIATGFCVDHRRLLMWIIVGVAFVICTAAHEHLRISQGKQD